MVKMFGKVYELGLILIYTIASGNLLKLKSLMADAMLGVRMYMRGKLALLPPRVQGKAEIKRMFEAAKISR